MRSRVTFCVLLLAAGCFSAPANPAGSGSATSSGGTGVGASTVGTSGSSGHAAASGPTSVGATTAGATSSGAVTSVGASTITGVAASTATSSSGATTGSTGSTGGSCNVNEPCAAPNQVCNVSLTACATGDVDVSNGGVCVPEPACEESFAGCEGAPCTGDADCDTFETCSGGTCQGMACPGLPMECPVGCQDYGIPHSCNSACVCSSCPSPDGGSRPSCDINSPCPVGDDCIFTTSLCPGAAGEDDDGLDEGGTCFPEITCPGGTCVGIACTADTDCADGEFCNTGACQQLECPPTHADCLNPECTREPDPHGCGDYCVCPVCPVDGGSSTFDGGGPPPDGGDCTCPFAGVEGYQCCGTQCAYTDGDTENCGTCGHACTAGEVCQNGGCTTAMCDLTNGCASVDAGGPATCCGTECCGAGSICCDVQEGVEYLACFDADAGCPLGCPICN